MEDTSKYPNLFAALLEDEEFLWTREDLGKLASANLIRVFKEVELVRDALQQMEEPYAELIPIRERDLEKASLSTKCMSKAGLERAVENK